MEPESKRVKFEKGQKWVLIEPIFMFNDRRSKPLGFMFDFLDKLIPVDEAPAIKNAAIHTYFCNWLMENPPRGRLVAAIDYVKRVMGSITRAEDSIRLIGEMEKDILVVVEEQNKELLDLPEEPEDQPASSPAPAAPRPPPTEDDILSKKYALNQDCLTVMLEIINRVDNYDNFVGHVQFVMRELSIKV
jgi:hypothetical protein